MDCSPGSSVHGIILTRILEWVAISSSRGSSQPRDWTLCLWRLLHWQADSLLLSHLGKPSVYLPFKEIGKMSSRVTVLFCIPSINIWTFHLLQILSSTLILSVFFFLNYSCSNRYVVVSVVLICSFLTANAEKAMVPHSSTLAWKIHGWRSLVGYSYGVAGSRTRLSDVPFTFHFHALEKEMATHSSVLAWRIPGTGELGGPPSMGLHRVRHDWSDLAAAAAAAATANDFKHYFVCFLCLFAILMSSSVHCLFGPLLAF